MNNTLLDADHLDGGWIKLVDRARLARMYAPDLAVHIALVRHGVSAQDVFFAIAAAKLDDTAEREMLVHALTSFILDRRGDLYHVIKAIRREAEDRAHEEGALRLLSTLLFALPSIPWQHVPAKLEDVITVEGRF